jgi:hypothetical protein
MKTSEFIRAAVNQYLSPKLRKEFNATATKYLCVAFDRFDSPDNSMNTSAKLKRIIEEDLARLGSGGTFYSAAIVNCGWREFEDNDEFQQLRFMYAEFLALYFEDLGD